MQGRDRDWLDALQRLLAPLAPRALALVEGDFHGEEVSWCDALPPDARCLATNAEPPPAAGWLVPLPATAGDGLALLIEGGAGLAPTEPPLVMARVLCRAAWRMRHPPGPMPATNELRQAVHDLRNGLNSVVMSSAVLGSASLPDNLRPFVLDLEQAGRRSLRALAELGTCLGPH